MSDKQDPSGYQQPDQQQTAEHGAYQQCTLTLGTEIL